MSSSSNADDAIGTRCTVVAAESLPSDLDAEGICGEINNALARSAGKKQVGGSVVVRVNSGYSLAATVVTNKGQKLPEIQVSISDRVLNERSLRMFADAIAKSLLSAK